MFLKRIFLFVSVFALQSALPQVDQSPTENVDRTTAQYMTKFADTLIAPFAWTFEKISDLADEYLGISPSTAQGTNKGQDAKNRSKVIDKAFSDGLNTQWDYFFLFLAIFMAGWSVSLTPCIYPLIPITIGIITSGRTTSVFMTILRSVFYVLGLASVFSLLGYISATSGMIFGQWMANPWVAGLIFVYFIALAMSMLGVYDINFGLSSSIVPEKMNVVYSFILGGLTGIVTSPCLTPPLMVVLGFVARQGDPILGMSLLFVFALGMSTILLSLAFFSGLVSMLPRPGAWMVEIKRVLGLVIIFFAINVLSPFLELYQILFAYGLLSTFIFFYYLLSSKRDAVLCVLKAQKEGECEENPSMSSLFSPTMLLKKVLMFLAFCWACFFFARTYTTYNKTSVKKVLIKLLS